MSRWSLIGVLLFALCTETALGQSSAAQEDTDSVIVEVGMHFVEVRRRLREAGITLKPNDLEIKPRNRSTLYYADGRNLGDALFVRVDDTSSEVTSLWWWINFSEERNQLDALQKTRTERVNAVTTADLHDRATASREHVSSTAPETVVAKIGMPIADATSLLDIEGMNLHPNETLAIVPPDGTELYFAWNASLVDALLVTVDDSTTAVVAIDWWVNFNEDVRQPKAYRKRQSHVVNAVTVAELRDRDTRLRGADLQEVVISIGMPLKHVTRTLENEGITLHQNDLAIEPAQGTALYYADHESLVDGLFVVVDKSNSTVVYIDWWVNYYEDSRRPKGLRKNQNHIVDAVTVADLRDRAKRLRDDADGTKKQKGNPPPTETPRNN